MVDSIAFFAILVGGAASILWLIDFTASRIGGRNTWFLLLGGTSFTGGVVVAYLNRAEWEWWQFILCPLGAPFIAAGVLLLAFTLVNPAPLIALVIALCLKARDRFLRPQR
jgi:hypothetical protein